MTTGGEDVVQEEGSQRDFVFDVADAETVDVALVECGDVTTDENGNVTFADDAENNGAGNDQADLGVTFASITAVNGVVIPGGTNQVDEEAPQDGTVSVTVQGDANERGCYVVVVFEDADDDDQLDLDADNAPSERFGISGETLLASVRGLDAEPESAVNRFGTSHTVTAQLIDRADETDTAAQPVPLAGETVRFLVFRGGTVNTTGPSDETCTGGTVIATGNDTTDENGQAEFSYTGPAEPTAGEANDTDVEDCIQAFHDENNNTVRDAGEASDAVTKTFSDDPNPQTLNAEPEQDTNLVGTRHTVTATATNRFGEAASGEQVVFEVFRDVAATTQQPEFRVVRTTDANGVATLTYTGPATEADDEIVVCVDQNADGDCETVITEPAPGDFVITPGETPNDNVEKFWVENAAAGDTTTASEPVIGFDKEADNVDVQDSVQGNLRFLYDANDQFTVVCTGAGTVGATDIAGFEAALSLDDTLDVDQFDPNGVSIFTLTDVDDSHPNCG